MEEAGADFSKASLEETPSVGTFPWDYTYDKDKADQLKTAQRKQVWAGGSSVLNTYNYTFDGIGNRTDRNYAANSVNQYKKNPDAANADIDYDLRGNMTSDGVFDFTWNSANQLTSATPRTVVTLEQEATAHEQGNDLPASRKVEFGYDDSGRRIWKKSYVYSSAASAWLARETRKFVYDGNNLVAEFVVDPNGMDRLSRAYAWGKGIAGSVGGLLSITTFADDGATPTATYIPLYDDRGNVVGLANATDGKLVAVYQYDPFGKLIGEAGDKAVLDANPFGFNTMFTDRETGLVWFQPGGYYSPALQRRLSREPAGEGESANLYVMFHNDPINRVDPDGYDDVLPGVGVDPKLLISPHVNWALLVQPTSPATVPVRSSVRMPISAVLLAGAEQPSILEDFRRFEQWRDSQFPAATNFVPSAVMSQQGPELDVKRMLAALSAKQGGWPSESISGWRYGLGVSAEIVIAAGERRDSGVFAIRHPAETYDYAVNSTAQFVANGMIARGDSSRGIRAAWDGLGYMVGSGTGVAQIGEAFWQVDLKTEEALTPLEAVTRGFEGLSTLSLSAAGLAGGYDPVLATGKLDRAITYYHVTGSAEAIREFGIDLSQSRTKLDFGPGFYTTTDPAQALRFGARFENPELLRFRVSSYKLNQLDNLVYTEASPGWGIFVRANRNPLEAPLQYIHGYDTISGPLLLRIDTGYEFTAGGQQTTWFSKRAVDLLYGGLEKK